MRERLIQCLSDILFSILIQQSLPKQQWDTAGDGAILRSIVYLYGDFCPTAIIQLSGMSLALLALSHVFLFCFFCSFVDPSHLSSEAFALPLFNITFHCYLLFSYTYHQ